VIPLSCVHCFGWQTPPAVDDCLPSPSDVQCKQEVRINFFKNNIHFHWKQKQNFQHWEVWINIGHLKQFPKTVLSKMSTTAHLTSCSAILRSCNSPLRGKLWLLCTNQGSTTPSHFQQLMRAYSLHSVKIDEFKTQ